MYNKTWREKRVNLNAGEKAVMYFDETIKPNTFIFVGSSQNIVVSTEREVSEQHYEMLINKNDTQIFAKPKNINALYIGNFGKEIASFLLYYSFGEFDANLLKRTNGTVTIDGILPAGENHIGSVSVDRALPRGQNYIGSVGVSGELPEGHKHLGVVTLNQLAPLPSGTNLLGKVNIENPIPAGNNHIGSVDITDFRIDYIDKKSRLFPLYGGMKTVNARSQLEIPTEYIIENGSDRFVFMLDAFYIKTEKNLSNTDGIIRLERNANFSDFDYNPSMLVSKSVDSDSKNVYKSDDLSFVICGEQCSKIGSMHIENYTEKNINIYIELWYLLVRKILGGTI